MTLVSSIGEGRRESFMPLVKDNLNSGLTLGLVRLIPIHGNILISTCHIILLDDVAK
jgi:hypothetical protein